MSENTIRAAQRRTGYVNDDMAARGFRAMAARTPIVEQLPRVPPNVMEARLAPGQSGLLDTTYDRAEFMARHRQLMTAWAAYLDRLRGGTGDRVPEGMTPVASLAPRLGC